MFDPDSFVAGCREALGESQPRLAIKEVLERALSDTESMCAALPPEKAGIEPLHVSPELTVLKVVWGPGMRLGPHDHRMWATIGIYNGAEDNAFFRRNGTSVIPSGGKALRQRDIVLLGDDVIHSVTNPLTELTGAIHIYGGDFFAMPRSEWLGEPPQEQPYNVERVLKLFEESNSSLA